MNQALESAISEALKQQDFDSALDLYSELFAANNLNTEGVARQHKLNAANLARKRLFDILMPEARNHPSIETAIHTHIGTQPFSYAQARQRPNFIYVPDLKAKPFWTISEIPGLEDLALQLTSMLQKQAPQLNHTVPYISEADKVPGNKQWNSLKSAWHQTVLLKGGKVMCEDDPVLCDAAHLLLTSNSVAQCPPHAPEAFFSKLSPQAYIPPHYGISNIKLTVHIPFVVNSHSSITVGGQTKRWIDEPTALVFDDSFEHEAINGGDADRVVLIFDVWHPQLSEEQRHCLQRIFRLREEWTEKFGRLAVLDNNL